jgi:hypothetical protein
MNDENKDEEDLALERDPSFWKMVQERRKERKSFSLDEVKKMLGLEKSEARSGKKPSKARKKSK